MAKTTEYAQFGESTEFGCKPAQWRWSALAFGALGRRSIAHSKTVNALTRAQWAPRMLVLALVTVLATIPAYAQSSVPHDTTWVTNGWIDAIATTSTTTYIGGSFTYVGPNTGGGVPLVAATGLPADVFPRVEGAVYACAPDGSGGWYIGGSFTQVGTAALDNIAHILANGSPDSAWNPGANSAVYALAVSGGTVYAGGQFTSVGGQTRHNIAALDATTGLATTWNPDADSTVYGLAVSGSAVYAGGSFTTIGGQTRHYIAALDATTGLATTWDPDASGNVYCVAVSGSVVYAGGRFTTIGGQTRNLIAGLNATTGLATTWDPNASGTVNPYVYSLAVSGSTVYVGGQFASIGGQTRNGLAGLSATTGLATTWNPNPSTGADGGSPQIYSLAVSGGTVYAGGYFTSIGGQARNYIAALSATTGLATAWDPNANAAADSGSLPLVEALAVSGGTVYAGGLFTSIGGETRNNIAALDATTGEATAWDPDASLPVSALAVSGSVVYAGGDFANIGGQPRNFIAALDATTGLAKAWDPDSAGPVEALAVSGSTVYAGGLFGTIGGETRNNIAALDATTGLAKAWDPNASNDPYVASVASLAVSSGVVYAGGFFTNIGGQARKNIAALNAGSGLATTWDPTANGIVFALVASRDAVYAGGLFTSIGGQTRSHIAALDVATGLATAWDPDAGGSNPGVYAMAISRSAVYVGGFFTYIGGQTQGHFAQFDLPPPATPTCDINSDGQVDAIDVQLAINAALGLDIGGLDADVNQDGAVNAIDVQLVINAALGL